MTRMNCWKDLRVKTMAMDGTKVDGPHGSSSVYVHGFGTDDGYGGHDAYGYGHIDPYLNTKHGYGYGHAGYGYGHHGVVGLGHGHHAGHHGFNGIGHHGGLVVSHGLGLAL